MWGKIFIILTNLSGLVTLYYGLKYKEYTIMLSIITTSIISLIFHLVSEYPLVNEEWLSFLRLLDFYYSYKSIYIVTTNFLTDYTLNNVNYDIVVSPVLMIMAKFLTRKNYFAMSIIPLSFGIVLPLLLYNKNEIISINTRDKRFWITLCLILGNIIFYLFEKNVDYYVFHSIHHLLCFSYPGLLIELKSISKNSPNPKTIIPKKNSLTNLSNIANITNFSTISEKVSDTVNEAVDNLSNLSIKPKQSYTNLDEIV